MNPDLSKLHALVGDSDVFQRAKREYDEWLARNMALAEQETKSLSLQRCVTIFTQEAPIVTQEALQQLAERISSQNGDGSVTASDILKSQEAGSSLVNLSGSGSTTSQEKRPLPPSHDPPLPPPTKKLRVVEPIISKLKRVFAQKEEKLNGRVLNVDHDRLEHYFFRTQNHVFKKYLDVADALGDTALEEGVRKVLQNDKDHDLMLKRRIMKLIQCVNETGTDLFK